MTIVSQRSFAGGEFSPSLYARVDFAKYASALRTCRNAFVLKHGGVSNRPGTAFVGEVNDSSVSIRLIPFIFNNDQTYVLEFGNEYMRVIKNGAHLTEAAKTITGTGITQANPAVVSITSHGYSNGDEVYINGVSGMTQVNNRNFKVANVGLNTFELQTMDGVDLDSSAYTAYSSGGSSFKMYQISTDYQTADLSTLQFVQSADIITIVHPSYPPAELARAGDISWTLTDITFAPLTPRPAGLSVTSGGAGSLDFKYTVTAIDEDSFEESLRGSDNSTYNISSITKNNPAVVTTSTAHNFANGDRIFINDGGGMIEVRNREYIVAGVVGSTFQLQGVDSTDYTTYTTGAKAARLYISIASAAAPTTSAPHVIAWTAVTGALEYNVYKEENGIFGLIGVAGSNTFDDTGITPNTASTPPINRNPFRGEDNYPSAVSYYQQRLLFGNTNNNPEEIQGSKSGNFKNFSRSSPIQDDDALSFTLAGRQVNSIKHMIDLGTLLVLTQGGEWSVQGSSGGVLTPSTIDAKQYSYNGSSDLYPIVINGNALYVQERGSIVRDIAFDFQVDGYRGSDVTILSSHLFEGYTLTDWAYQRVPNSILWCVRSDGALLGLTYIPEQEMFAWHRHDFGDDIVENVCVVPENDEDILYVTVKRTINSATVRYIERMNTRLVLNRLQIGGVIDLRDLTYLDSYLTYDGRSVLGTTMTLSGGTTWAYDEDLTLTASVATFASGDIGNQIHIYLVDAYTNITDTVRCSITAFTSTTIVTVRPNKTVPAALRAVATNAWGDAVDVVTGLWHLEGKDVSVYADGFVTASPNNDSYTTVTVTNGAITLDKPYVVIHVGLPYVSDIETLDIDNAGGATLADTNKLITKLNLFVEKSRGMWVGPKPPSDDNVDILENLRELKIRNSESYDSPIELKTDNVEINMKGEWNNNGRIFIRQVDPVPMSILAVMPSGKI